MTLDRPFEFKCYGTLAGNPEAAGFRILRHFSDGSLSYEFDEILVLQDLKDRKVYAVQDSGCSCPSPFEDVRKLSDLTHIPSRHALREFLKPYKYVTHEETEKLIQELGRRLRVR